MMQKENAIKIAAAVGAVLIYVFNIAIIYAFTYCISLCFDISITFKVATGIMLSYCAVHILLKSATGGTK